MRGVHRGHRGLWGYGYPYGDCDYPYNYPQYTNNDECDY
jgi:hypothetical protein